MHEIVAIEKHEERKKSGKTNKDTQNAHIPKPSRHFSHIFCTIGKANLNIYSQFGFLREDILSLNKYLLSTYCVPGC